MMRLNASPEVLSLWRASFPGQIPDRLVSAEELEGNVLHSACPLGRTRGGWRSRKDWIRALDTIESLQPRAVVASHKRPENDDSPRIIEQTRQYIRDFDRLVETTTTAQQLYDRMLELYPNRVNAGWALWSSARAVKR